MGYYSNSMVIKVVHIVVRKEKITALSFVGPSVGPSLLNIYILIGHCPLRFNDKIVVVGSRPVIGSLSVCRLWNGWDSQAIDL